MRVGIKYGDWSRLSYFRKKAKMSKRKMSRISGMRIETINRVEAGQEVNFKTIQKYCLACNVTELFIRL